MVRMVVSCGGLWFQRIVSLDMRGPKLCGRSCEIAKICELSVCMCTIEFGRGSWVLIQKLKRKWNRCKKIERANTTKIERNMYLGIYEQTSQQNRIKSTFRMKHEHTLCHYYYYGQRHIHLWNVNEFFLSLCKFCFISARKLCVIFHVFQQQAMQKQWARYTWQNINMRMIFLI